MERNKKAIIITALLIIVSVLLIAFGLWGDMLRSFGYQSQSGFYPTKVTDNDIGKKYRIPFFGDTLDGELENYYFQALADPNVSEENYKAFWFGLDINKLDPEKAVLFSSPLEIEEECYITGILRKYDAEFEQQARFSLEAGIDEYYDGSR